MTSVTRVIRRAVMTCAVEAGRREAALALAVALAAGLLSSPRPADAATLRYQNIVAGDVALIGNTLGYDCAPGSPLPVVGTVGGCGSLTGDISPDVFWVAADAGGALADDGNLSTSARSTAMLKLPAGATVTYARLYWSAAVPTATPGTQVTLDRAGTAGFSATVTADASFTTMSGASGQAYYQSTAEVTSLVQANGAGSYRVTGPDTFPLQNVDSDWLYDGWWMVVFYRSPGSPARSLAIFDGLDSVEATGPPQTVSVSGFQVPFGTYDAKLGVVGYLGTSLANGDRVTFNGVTLSNGMNPPDQFFNGTRSFLGVPVSNAGDLPQLTGTPRSMSGMDLDVVDVAPLLTFGDTTATITADTRSASYVLGAFVTSITTTGPDLSPTTKTVTNLNAHPGGAVLPGDILEYKITVTNKGTDTAVGVVLDDLLPAGLVFVPGSIAVTAGPNVGPKTDLAGDDQAEFVSSSGTVRVRLGTGADEMTGGRMAQNDSATVVFRAQVSASKRGLIANQATVTASGQSGVAVQTFFSDGNPTAAGAQTTDVFVDQCGSSGDCSAPTPVCFTTTSPKRCVACVSSGDCSGTTPVCNRPTNSCRVCRVSSECPAAAPVCDSTGACVQCLANSDCSGATPVCNLATKACVGCLTGADCGGTKPTCDAATLTCRGCAGDGECGGATPACQLSGACGQCSATNATACGSATPVCEVGAGICVRCVANADCGGTTPICNGATHLCRGCAGDGECGGAMPACQPSGACGQCSATNASACVAPTPVCAVRSGTCVECLSNGQCGGARPVCDLSSNSCRACAADSECPVGAPACDPGGACVRCLANRHCSGATPVCDTATKACVGCLTNGDCGGVAPVCNPSTQTCRMCARDADCGGSTPACQPSGACGQCSAINSSRCGGATPVCDTAAGACVGCTGAADCGGTAPVCDGVARVCRGCRRDSECPASAPACQPSGACGQCSAQNASRCGGRTPVCDAASGTCVGCVANADCGGATPVCDGATHTCRGCGGDGDCGGARPACQPSGACGQCSAANRGACVGATPLCDGGRGACVACLSGGDCGGGTPVCDGTTKTCRACAGDSDCGGATPACQTSGACGKCSATNSSMCGGSLPACDVAAGLCVACLSDAQCSGTTPVCNVATHTCRACVADAECPAAAPACQPSGACGVCSATNSARCVRATATCDVKTGTCQSCVDDGQCGGTLPVCDGSTHTCRACNGDGECGGATPACQASGACRQCSATNARACAAPTPLCDAARGACAGCLVNDDCAGARPICEPTTNACRGCAADAECGAATPICSSSGRCIGTDGGFDAGADGAATDGAVDGARDSAADGTVDGTRDRTGDLTLDGTGDRTQDGTATDAGADLAGDGRGADSGAAVDSGADRQADSSPVGKLSGPGCACDLSGRARLGHVDLTLVLGALLVLSRRRRRSDL